MEYGVNEKDKLDLHCKRLAYFDVAISYATEQQDLAETIYYCLRGEGLSVFYAPAPECQAILSGENQREIFYRIFGLQSEYVILLVSQHYVAKRIPMEEAEIAFTKHREDGKVLPILLDGTLLPKRLLDPKKQNYFSSSSAVEIADHVSRKIKKKNKEKLGKKQGNCISEGAMINEGNVGGTQIFIQNYR